ncbi:hypothetical protein [Paraburkholderia sp.]|uniref:hypothetical protein n=1 Tax=Paraburkholderia sp. TaxID=1926495 RepID=UPI00238DF31C|nr:hypothetical protein [Paraburkholderia sp.]MDE1181172.1 hypothetical protein [Paraburkholderia sp.]
MFYKQSSLKMIAAAAQADFWSRHQVPPRLRALATPLLMRAALWMLAACALLVGAVRIASGDVALALDVAGALAVAWSVVLASFAVAFFIAASGSPRDVFRRRF